MDYQVNQIDNSQLEFKITVTPEEYEQDMKDAAKDISEKIEIDGFRKGKAPYDVVKRKAGEMKILQHAINSIVEKTFVEAVNEEDVDTLGSPEINVEQVVPGNDLVYKATVATLPEIDLATPSEITVEKSDKKVTEEDVEESLLQMRKMQSEEEKKEGKAEDDDKVVLDLDMSIDGVPVDGGQAKDYQVYLDEKQKHIPGFNEKIEGLEAGDEKTFTLDFPENHYQNNLAGETVDFDVTINEVYKRVLPEANEEFAKKLGYDSMDKLKDLIKRNLKQETKQKEDQQLEISILNKMIEKSEFSEIPEKLVDAERQKMFHELKNDLEQNGVTVEQYLEDIKKTEEELMEGFTEDATKRAKTALISRAIAKQNDLGATEEELEQEIEKIRQKYKDNEQAQERLEREDVRDTIATTVQNRKVVKWLKEQVTIEEAESEE